MKNVLALGVCICSLVGVAAAQTGNLMTVKLPNATLVGTTTLPAGNYTVREIEGDGNSGIIQFTDNKGDVATVIAMEIPVDSSTADRTKVILKSDGEGFKVDKLWVEDRPYGFQIAK
jgi:hypothetical protein